MIREKKRKRVLSRWERVCGGLMQKFHYLNANSESFVTLARPPPSLSRKNKRSNGQATKAKKENQIG